MAIPYFLILYYLFLISHLSFIPYPCFIKKIEKAAYKEQRWSFRGGQDSYEMDFLCADYYQHFSGLRANEGLRQCSYHHEDLHAMPSMGHQERE